MKFNSVFNDWKGLICGKTTNQPTLTKPLNDYLQKLLCKHECVLLIYDCEFIKDLKGSCFFQENEITKSYYSRIGLLWKKDDVIDYYLVLTFSFNLQLE